MGLPYKRGTQFDFGGVVSDVASGEVADLTGHTFTAQLRRWSGGAIGDLIADLEIDAEPESGTFRVFFSDQDASASWPLGSAAFDIIVTTPGGARLPTRGYVLIDIIKAATQVAP